MNKKIDSTAWKSLLTSNEVLIEYGDNAIGLLALSLKFDIDDIALAGVDSFVDGRNDKKNDFIYIDEERGCAVIIQAYYTKASKQIAPSNKAADLSTAVLWLLSAPEDELPDEIKSHAQRLREGLLSNKIKKIHVWYVHNCTESSQVETELLRVNECLVNILRTRYKSNDVVPYVLEVGKSTLSEWYLQGFSPIFVEDDVVLSCTEGFKIDSEKWESFVTNISARELHYLYKKYKVDLFSANVRDYLGDRETDNNINSGIKNSIRRTADDFWVFNNGLTILVNDFEFLVNDLKLNLKGISIVNGAQTTGAIGTLQNPPKHEARILVRFIKVKNNARSVISNIVKYNNSQNKVTAADFRSNDVTQKRLVQEIAALDKQISYQGGRRGGDKAAIIRKRNILPSFTVAQALAAFHGDPINAYNRKSYLWTDDGAYSKIFNEKTTGAHLIFVFSLYKRLEEIKFRLLSMGMDSAKDSDKRKIEFFRRSGSIFVYMYALSKCIEIFVEKAVTDKFTLNFGVKGFDSALKNWDPVISHTMSFVSTLGDGMKKGLSEKEIDSSVDRFRQLIDSYFENVAQNDNRFKREIRFK